MKKMRTGTAQKITAIVLFVISVAVFLASAVLLVVFDAEGVYRTEKAEMLRLGYEQVCKDYSIIALAGYNDDFSMEQLSDTNFRYGVIQVQGTEEPDYWDKNSYIMHNFDDDLENHNLYFYKEYVGEHSEFVYGDDISDSFYIYQHDSVTETEYSLDGYYYDWETQELYVRSGRILFPIDNYAQIISGDKEGGYVLDDSFLDQEAKVNENYMWQQPSSRVHLEEYDVTLHLWDIEIVSEKELFSLGTLAENSIANMDSRNIYTREKTDQKSDSGYLIVSYVNLPLTGPASYWDGDMLMQMRIIVDLAYQLRYPIIAAIIMSLIIGIGSFVYLMLAAGHHKGYEGIHAVMLDKCPVDFYLACVFTIEMWLIALVVNVGREFSPLESVLFWVVTFCGGSIGIVLFVLYCMSFAVNVKCGKWRHNTIIYIICKKGWHFLKKMWGFISQVLSGIRLFWKVCFVLGALTFLEFLLMSLLNAWWYYDEALLVWLFFKFILFTLISLVLVQMEKLKRGAQRIAIGELHYKINTDKMLSDLKEHGECLNSIGLGMTNAVNERLKSERFKTELITNVSHDIKTPLTSIINYVDLLEKEQLENPTAQEYVQVLIRQSARLKKLIEDLMEASKASTGNLNIVMEQCDTGVMLVQTIGEYEERLMKNEIELQIKRPQEQIIIEADSRHLWRVFDNLMNNICKYAQPHTRAYVNLEQEEERAVITFRNISHCQLNISSEELMERFVRGDSSRNTEGSGLGLSIARSLTDLMNGSFELVIDGDLFKVILSFPVYGSEAAVIMPEQAETESDREIMPAIVVKAAGTRVKHIGRGVTRWIKNFFKKLGRFFRGVKIAAANLDEPEDKNQ